VGRNSLRALQSDLRITISNNAGFKRETEQWIGA
jgi:hypothetical protein